MDIVDRVDAVELVLIMTSTEEPGWTLDFGPWEDPF